MSETKTMSAPQTLKTVAPTTKGGLPTAGILGLVQSTEWQTVAQATVQKKADRKAISKYLRVKIAHNSPIEKVIDGSDFYDAVKIGLSCSRTGAIKAKFAGMKNCAIIRSENIPADVVLRFYPAVVAEKNNAQCAILTEKGVKMDVYAFAYLPATDGEIKAVADAEKAKADAEKA